MQTTFNDKQEDPQNDEQRRLDNAARANKGEAQVGGSAGRQQVADKNPAGEQALDEARTNATDTLHPRAEHDNRTGGPGSAGGKPVQDPVI